MTEQDKQSAILAATLDLIAENGFHAAPMSQVAKRSGVSAGIIYHYFVNKDALIHELYRHIKRQFSEALLAGAPHNLAWPESMQQLWLNAFAFYASHPKETRFLEQYENSPFVEAIKPELDENFLCLKELIDRLITEGRIRALSYEVLYELSIGVALSLAKRQLAGSIKLSQDELEAVAVACRQAIAI